MAARAQPQWAGGRQHWPEHWGISRSQIQELLVRLRQDAEWSGGNSMYTLVQDFIIPWTRGSGQGYALALNAASPLEVQLMVSHSWAENAEAFLEALLRSTGPRDVLFVCALSLYQAEDGYGPSIADQIGGAAAESPFRRVLEHVQHTGKKAGMLWRWRPVLAAVPSACLLLAACLYLVPLLLWPCVPGFRQCARMSRVRPTANTTKIDWLWEAYPHPAFGLVPALAMLCAALAALTFAALWWIQPYAGRMLVVPCRECDIYTRLWCTYEVFTAQRLGVHVKLADTLATAGLGRSEEARCSSEEDAQRIRGEIADEGHTFTDIDRAVQRLFWRRFRSVARTCAVSTIVLTVCVLLPFNEAGGGHLSVRQRGSTVAATLLASAFVVMVVYLMASWNQGVVSVPLAFTTSAGSILLGISGQVIDSGFEMIWVGAMLQLAGVSVLVMSVGASARVRCHPVVEVMLAAGAIWFLNENLLPTVRNGVWRWSRGLPWSPVVLRRLRRAPPALASCQWGDHPYACAVWLGADLGKSIVPACLLVAQAAAWGVRPRRAGCCGGGRVAAGAP